MNGRFVRTDVPCWYARDRRHEMGDDSPFCVRCGKLVVETGDRPAPDEPIPTLTHADKLHVIALLGARDGFACFYCTGTLLNPADEVHAVILGGGAGGRLPLHAQYPTIDHVIPRAAGGRSTLGNMVLSCPKCNERKGDQMTVIVEMVFALRRRLSELEDTSEIYEQC